MEAKGSCYTTRRNMEHQPPPYTPSAPVLSPYGGDARRPNYSAFSPNDRSSEVVGANYNPAFSPNDGDVGIPNHSAFSPNCGDVGIPNHSASSPNGGDVGIPNHSAFSPNGGDAGITNHSAISPDSCDAQEANNSATSPNRNDAGRTNSTVSRRTNSPMSKCSLTKLMIASLLLAYLAVSIGLIAHVMSRLAVLEWKLDDRLATLESKLEKLVKVKMLE